MKFKAKLVTIGNSNGFVVPSALIKTGLISKDETYEIYVQTKHDKMELENERMKRKLKEMNRILIEKGIEPVLDEDFNSKVDEKKVAGRGFVSPTETIIPIIMET